VADGHGSRRVGPAAIAVAAALGAALVVSACGAAGASFSTNGPCLADGRSSGAYPQLEALVPKSISSRPATTVDSGRNCTSDSLGSFMSHGVQEIDFAGATWDEGGGNGVSIAVLTTPGAALPAAWAEEFYTLGAAKAKDTGNLETTRPTYPGAGSVFRLDTLNDLSFQTVVVWADGNADRVVIVATEVGPTASKTVHDARVAEAVGAAAVAETDAHAAAGSSSPLGSPSAAGSPSSPGPVLPSPS
jgi:hypothetical protein